MPYKSKAQAAYIHIKAEQDEPWAKKFVKDAHGTHVKRAYNDAHKAMHRHKGK